MGTTANLTSGPTKVYIKDSGTLTGATITAGGTGYTNGAAAIIDPPAPGGTQAVGTIVVTTGAITGVTITNPGSGYRVPPVITAAGGSGANVVGILTLVDTEIGFTKGGVKVDVVPHVLNLLADQLGSTEANTIITGVSAKVHVPFAEITLLTFARAFSNAVPLQDDTTGSKKRVEIRPLSGKSLLAIAKTMTLKPIDPNTGVETTNKDLWVTIPLAAPDESNITIDYAAENQRILDVSFKCFPDTDTNKNRLLFFGDSTVVDANESGF